MWVFHGSFATSKGLLAALARFLKLCAVFMYLDHFGFSIKSSPALLLFTTWSWLGAGYLGFCLHFCVSLVLSVQEIIILSFFNKHSCSKEHFQSEHDEKIKPSESS